MSRSPAYLNRIKAARAQLLDRGVVPEGLLPDPIGRSWSRCAVTGLSLERTPSIAPLEHHALLELKEKNFRLLHQAKPEMESLQSQIAGTQSMIILTDATGTILHALGDTQFINKAQRVALQPGVSWREENTGTNAIGTALIEQSPVVVMGAEHYFKQNAFLNCSATPILDPYGQTIGVLDVSGDHRQPQGHTLALVRMSAQMIENRLFSTEFSRDITLHFHARPEVVGTLWEGIAVFSPVGRLLAVNKSGLLQLGLEGRTYGGIEFSALFDSTLEALLEKAHHALPNGSPLTTHNGHRLYARVEIGRLSIKHVQPTANQTKTKVPVQAYLPDFRLLDALDSGDREMQKAICALKKVLGREIPILIEGETGTGKELLAKAVHAAGLRRKGPFIAINCASIPEGLIEAELFGYEDGAFTGAKRSGVQGKIMQASGGTLFLDEIGDMPLSLQARLLRVLQEREITPLGGSKATSVDIAVISATNRKLRTHVEQGRFRDDLYYRLNGLRITLPPLRQREDIIALAEHILNEENDTPVSLHSDTIHLFQNHPWHGNVRQLRNVLRTSLAFLENSTVICPHHLPEDFIEEFDQTLPPSEIPRQSTASSIQASESHLIRQALHDHNGNMTIAAKHLGISRATLYRKVKRLQTP